MYDKFSVEEINLMCIFDTSDKAALLTDLWEKIDYVYDPDMREIFESAIEKLESISDDDFEDIGFYMADEDDEDIGA
jgi:hypothetical protein